MDRSKWEYKRLGEVCTVVSGSTPKTQVEEFWNGNHYWITPAELDGRTYVSKSERLITDEAIEKTNLTLLPVGTVLLSSRAPIGKVAITTVPMYCNQGFKNLICSDAMYNKYLYWFLKVNTEYLNSLGRGATFKEISKTIVENIKVPIYSFKDQQRIVAELDCLNEMIVVKQEQLKEFDKLAQSIFYDMFGDPVSNEKGWEKCNLGKQIKVIGGYAYKSSSYIDDGIRLVQISNVWEDSVKWDDITCVPNEDAMSHPLFILKPGDIVMALTRPIIKSLGTVKIARIRECDTPCVLNQRVCKYDFSDSHVSPNWFYHFARTKYFKDRINAFSSKGMQPNVSTKEIESIKFPLPPLSLQQQFAEKIQAIEEQKELVKQSIAETQHLLDSRMDYYFD